jgi:glycosyltransferase involved in cell wall biosynthesis
MKLLWLSHFIPYPPRGGSRQRSFNLIRHISRKYETYLLALNMQNESRERVTEFTSELKKHCAEVEIWDLPYAWRGVRWWAQLTLSPLSRYPYGCRALWSTELGRRWSATLGNHPEALLHFDSIDLALYLPPASGHRKVLNHHNCESAMAERRAQKEPNPIKKAYLWHQARKLRRLEESICHQFDVNLTVSELDTETLQERNPQARYHVVENGTDTDYFHPSDAPPEPNTIVFAGSLDWYPNVQGIHFFVRKVWPLLKSQIPRIRLYLVGQRPDHSLTLLPEYDPDIILVADPEDVRPWVWKASAVVCPILDGGGTRLKILDALAAGKAIVSTTIGCEGLLLKHGEHVLLADTPEDFAAEVARVIRDDTLRKSLGRNGRVFVESTYGWNVVCLRLVQAYESACALRSNGKEPRGSLKGSMSV